MSQRKRVFIAAIFCFVFCAMFIASLKAQDRYSNNEGVLYEITDRLAKLEAKVDKLQLALEGLDKNDKEITNKMSQTLANQAKIMEELEVVKVRASRR